MAPWPPFSEATRTCDQRDSHSLGKLPLLTRGNTGPDKTPGRYHQVMMTGKGNAATRPRDPDASLQPRHLCPALHHAAAAPGHVD